MTYKLPIIVSCFLKHIKRTYDAFLCCEQCDILCDCIRENQPVSEKINYRIHVHGEILVQA